ncbi:MAG: hypothetical protein MJ117_03575 [Lachnospiraceae bacterium]|nr:hypothetical protein [Lachnospiraceae bacterium]
MKRSFVTTIAAVSLAAMMAVSLTACGGKGNNTQEATTASTSATMVNPMKEMSEADMTQETGIDLPAPEGATDVVYSVIDTGDAKIAQMNCTYDGQEICLRACHTDLTGLEQTDPNADPRNFDLDEEDISGLCYDWNQVASRVVKNRSAIAHVSNDGPGYIAWVDVVPGILYNLSVTDDANLDALTNTAEIVFVPMQGEV